MLTKMSLLGAKIKMYQLMGEFYMFKLGQINFKTSSGWA